MIRKVMPGASILREEAVKTMNSWRQEAVVWFNDALRGLVVAGSFGAAWRVGTKVHVVLFKNITTRPLFSLSQKEDWAEEHVFTAPGTTRSALVRFVRTGLMPAAQGKLA